MESIKIPKCLNALQLKILAMVFMVCSHLWGTVVYGNGWLYSVGRLAFPIFAFLIVEGFFHTRDFKKYWKRVFVFALLSELPFDLMDGALFDPFHQNVLFTFCIALALMAWMEKAKQGPKWRFLLRAAVSVVGGFLLGFVTMVDYFGYGVLMVLVFYLFRDMKLSWLAQLVCMVYINWEMMGGLVYFVPMFGRMVEISQQGLAVLALIPIWLYNGEQGAHSKIIQYGCYAFYPIHIAVLAVWMRL